MDRGITVQDLWRRPERRPPRRVLHFPLLHIRKARWAAGKTATGREGVACGSPPPETACRCLCLKQNS